LKALLVSTAAPGKLKGLFYLKIKSMNILEKANEIVNLRQEEKERQYGDFHLSMQKTAEIASLMSNKQISVQECYNVLIALKLARQSNAHKEDNLLDAVAYMGSLNDYLNKIL
jgi:hypothetical protein